MTKEKKKKRKKEKKKKRKKGEKKKRRKGEKESWRIYIMVQQSPSESIFLTQQVLHFCNKPRR